MRFILDFFLSFSSFIFAKKDNYNITKKTFRFDAELKYNVMPLIITKWNDQSAFHSSHRIEDLPLQLRNYVNIINSICEFIPDGVVIFLPNVKVLMKFLNEKRDELLS